MRKAREPILEAAHQCAEWVDQSFFFFYITAYGGVETLQHFIASTNS